MTSRTLWHLSGEGIHPQNVHVHTKVFVPLTYQRTIYCEYKTMNLCVPVVVLTMLTQNFTTEHSFMLLKFDEFQSFIKK